MTAGSELREARERAGLAAIDISERTKIQIHRIEALERDDFGQLPQGIYLDGIVRAYANEVGMDPEPMVERVRLERGQLPGDWEVPFDAPIELYPNATPDVRVLELSDDNNLDEFATEEDLARARSAAAAHSAESREGRRKFGLAIPLLAMVAAAGWGAYLGERHSAHPDTPVAETEQSDVNTARPAPERESSSDIDSRPVATQTPSELSQDTPSRSYTPAPQARATSGTVAQPSAAPAETRAEPPAEPQADRPAQNRPAEPPPQAAPQSTPPAQTERTESPSSERDVTGSWRIATQIESTSYAAYSGLRLGYELQLAQEGARVTGTGRKVSENGNGIGPRAQTPVTVSGTIEGDRLTLNFIEQGARRPTQGKFVLLVDDDQTLRGRFSSDAAQSSGRVEAHRVASQ